ncbi:MAG: CoA transferase, partial [Thermoleophilaceae bacterium]|nr:CoA transferase [Thermoleophilaceae bacterium]
ATVGVDHPTAGQIELVASPIRMEGMRPAAPPPLLGQHTAEVLAELGCSPERLEELVAQGVAAVP